MASRFRNRSRGSGFPSFDPAGLFAGGEEGVLFDRLSPADGFLFQDSGLTTPVTAAGQPVGGIVDRSGKGNNALQATAGFRPLLQQDSSAQWYLDFDGVDDYLETASIDFTSTDQITISGGINKASDTGGGTLCELSVSSTSNSGTFGMFAPSSGGTTYRMRTGGTSSLVVSSSAHAAPSIDVVTGLADISDDTALIRTDGTQEGSNGGDQGTGNYGTYPLFIGARAGTSIFFTGRVYALIIRNVLTSGLQLDNLEGYIAGKTTGVSV